MIVIFRNLQKHLNYIFNLLNYIFLIELKLQPKKGKFDASAAVARCLT